MRADVLSTGWAALILALCLAAGWLLQLLCRRMLARMAARTSSPVDDALVEGVGRFVVLWALLLGLVLAAPLLGHTPRMEQGLRKASGILFLVSLTLFLAKLAMQVTPVVARRLKLPLSTTTFTSNFIRGFILVLGTLLVLSNLGIAIGPLLTALGVGSLAVGLALQDMLSNLFAGFYLLLSRQIEVGDFIEVERGIGYGAHRGYVVDLNWRVSTIRTLNGTLVWIPNAFLTQAIIRRFDVSAERSLVPIEFQLSPKADLALADAAARQAFTELAVPSATLQRVQFLSAREPLIMTVVIELPRWHNQEFFATPYIQKARSLLAAQGLL